MAVWECGDDKAPGPCNAQSAYIKGRQIIDGPLIVNELISWSKKHKSKLMIFKVDFEKAFDSIHRNFLDNVTIQMGFGFIWLNWIKGCFNSVTSSGDSCCSKPQHYFSSSADDVLFVGEWSEGNVKYLVRILRCYQLSSGLKVNLSKSCIYGVRVPQDHVNTLAHEVKCNGTPKLHGGLGIGSLKAANRAFLSCWWWRILSDKSALWNSGIVSIHGYLGGTNLHDYESTNNGCWKSIVKAGMEIHNTGFHFFETLNRKECCLSDRCGSDDDNFQRKWDWRRPIRSGREMAEFNELIELLCNIRIVQGKTAEISC
nr:RNA-directed DNA polymerase, eukaryota, reverse transcriptase zinc-binding domain protein [Tanacetum cinerariifolium]